MARYFVMHLTDRDLKDRRRPLSEKRFEIQLLDASGQAVSCGYVDYDQSSLEVDGKAVPFAVIAAARRQATGNGDYVDDCGNSVPVF